LNGDLSSVGLSSFVMWWRMSVDDVTQHEREYHDDDNNDNETTTINRKRFTKLKYNNSCLLLLV
jgi:hypothetical protein